MFMIVQQVLVTLSGAELFVQYAVGRNGSSKGGNQQMEVEVNLIKKNFLHVWEDIIWLFKM